MVANVLYLAGLLLISPLVLYRMIFHGRYRRGLSEKLLGLSADRIKNFYGDADQCIWIHAVSVGEVNLLVGFVEQLKKRVPELAVAISTSTDTGYDVAVQRFGKDRVFFCPLDFTWAVRRTINNLRPKRLILAELELWPNLIRQATETNCEVMVVNARLSERSAQRYQRFAFLTKAIFQQLSWVG